MRLSQRSRWESVGGLVVAFLVLLLIAGSAWAWVAGPCWIYTFASGSEIPGRCLMP